MLMTVGKIVEDADRALLYPISPQDWTAGYHIVADIAEVKNLKIGDQVSYEPYGFNFGWFIGKCEQPNKEKS